MAHEAFDKETQMQRALADLIEASRRLRERAKENTADADRIMATVKELERTFKEHTKNSAG